MHAKTELDRPLFLDSQKYAHTKWMKKLQKRRQNKNQSIKMKKEIKPKIKQTLIINENNFKNDNKQNI